MGPETLIAARPHFRREGNQLFFFLSKRPFISLNRAEALLWDRLQEDAAPGEDLPDLAAAKSLVDAGVAEAIEPITKRDRKRILVIEPHCDDAALSIGATMWKLRNEVEFHLLTMASRSNYTTAFHLHRDYFDPAKITAMRTREGQLFAAHLGGHYYCAGMSEATLRYADSDWDLDFFKAHEVPIAISNNRRAQRSVLNAWVTALESFLKDRSFDEIWIPLGAGTHSDHDLARNAALEVILQERPATTLRLYEDVPYGSEFQEHTDRILSVLRGAGATLSPWTQEVAGEYASKLSLLSLFASQFKVRSIEPGVERSARADGGSRTVERLWTLEALPRSLPEDELWIGAPAIRRTSAELPNFRRGADVAPRAAIFAISASGRWAADLKVLGEVFPAASFVVYAGPRVCAEFRALRDPRVDVHCLDGGSMSWAKAALREALTSHRLVIAGDGTAKAKALMMLSPIGRTLICSDIDHVMQALTAD